MIDQAFKPIAAALAALLLAGCTVGPDYVRPETELPQTLGVPQTAVAAADQWWKLFQDPVLDRLVEETLAYDRNGNVDEDRTRRTTLVNESRVMGRADELRMGSVRDRGDCRVARGSRLSRATGLRATATLPGHRRPGSRPRAR